MRLLKLYIYVFLSVTLAETAKAQVELPDKIIYGTVYNIFHDRFETDQDFYNELDKDLNAIKSAGFNTVMPFPFGQWDRQTKEMDWTRTDYLVNQIEEHQLNLMPIMLKSTHRAYLPTWKWVEIDDAVREFPEVSRTSEDVKYMHPEVMRSIEYYFSAVANRYKEKGALIGYNLWNEAHYYSMDEITIPKFRVWLQGKYGNLDRLNRVWGEDYNAWDQITPLMSRNWESSMAAIDWDLFRYDNNGDIAEWAYQTMRKYDQKNFLTINTVGTVVNNPEHSQWTVDGSVISPHTDVWGISFYPDKHMNRTGQPMPYWKYSSMFNVTRSDADDKPYFLVEAQTNQQNGMGLFQYMSYDDIYLLSWIAFADNCKGIIFWKWKPFYRGQQAFGRGLTYANGDLAPRGQAARDVATVLNKHGELILKGRLKPSEVGILYDIVSLQKSFESENRPASKGKNEFFIQESYEGTYKALFDQNISADLIRTDHSISLSDLKKYRILYLPYQMVVRREVASILKEYVKNGGWLVADARSAVMDEYDFGQPVNPAFGLDSLFGAFRLDQYAADSIYDVRSIGPETVDFQGKFFKELLEPYPESEVLAQFSGDQSPALIANTYGKGKTFLCATSLGGSYYQGVESSGRLISDLAEKAGVQSIESEVLGQLMIKVHDLPDGEQLVYLNNLSDKDYNGNVSVNIDTNVKKVIDLITDKKVAFNPGKSSLSFDVSISGYRTKVLWVQR